MINTGLKVFLKERLWLNDARVGLVSHPAAVLPDLTHALDAMLDAGVNIVSLFGPEHGYLGWEADGLKVGDVTDPRTGLPAYSLYGDHLAPTTQMLADIDVLIYDMQDIGARFYTFISTLFHILKSAGENGKKVIVLDRPNPLGGEMGISPLVSEGFETFIGIASMPIVHGMTVGEIAGWMNAECALNADLSVVKMQGWQRWMGFADTGLPWIPTSPGMPQVSTTIAYPCTCFIEGTNLSEGRGTPLPFEVFGAPFLNGYSLAAALNGIDLPGVRFRPTVFTPFESKHKDKVCEGIQVHVTDWGTFKPVITAMHVFRKLVDLVPEFSFLDTSWEGNHPHFDLLIGNDEVRKHILQGFQVEEITAGWREVSNDFFKKREPYLLYE